MPKFVISCIRKVIIIGCKIKRTSCSRIVTSLSEVCILSKYTCSLYFALRPYQIKFVCDNGPLIIVPVGLETHACRRESRGKRNPRIMTSIFSKRSQTSLAKFAKVRRVSRPLRSGSLAVLERSYATVPKFRIRPRFKRYASNESFSRKSHERS